MFCRITVPPKNTLVNRCAAQSQNGPSASMNCSSNATGVGTDINTISWVYDGNTVISVPCVNNTQVIIGDPDGSTGPHCGIRAYMDEAYDDSTIRYISGPYGCSDQTNNGVTQTSTVVVLGSSLRFLHCLRLPSSTTSIIRTPLVGSMFSDPPARFFVKRGFGSDLRDGQISAIYGRKTLFRLFVVIATSAGLTNVESWPINLFPVTLCCLEILFYGCLCKLQNVLLHVVIQTKKQEGGIPQTDCTSTSYHQQEAQLMLTTGSTHLAVSRGQQTWYHFGSIATFR